MMKLKRVSIQPITKPREWVSVFVSILMALFCQDWINQTSSMHRGDNYWPAIVVICVFGVLIYVTLITIPTKIGVSSGVLLVIWYVSVIRPLTSVPDYGINLDIQADFYYITTANATCRQCLFYSKPHGFNYTVITAPPPPPQVNGVVTNKHTLSHFLAMENVFQDATSSSNPWIIVFEDDAQLLPHFMSHLGGFLRAYKDADMISLDGRGGYAWILLGKKMVEASVAIAYNRRNLKEFSRISNPNSTEVIHHIQSGGRQVLSNVFAELCNHRKLRCNWGPFVREFDHLSSTLGY